MVLEGSFSDTSAVHDSTLHRRSSSSSGERRSISPAQQGQSGLRPQEQCSITGPPPIRRPLTPILSQPKHKLQPNSGQQTPKTNMSRKSLPSVNRRSRDGSSASSVSSSSSSSPKTGSSPNDSFHQHRPRLQILPSKPQPAIYPGPPSSGHSSSRKTPIHHPSQHRLFHSTPASNPCSCCTNQPAPSHTPMYQNNTWQGMSAYPTNVHTGTNNPTGHCGTESVPHGESYLSPSRPSLACHMSPTQSPVCHGNVPAHCSPSHGHCVPAARGSEQVGTSCQTQCCQVQSNHAACSDTPSGSVGMLPADAYRMLKDQERQLKLLQLQVCISHEISN